MVDNLAYKADDMRYGSVHAYAEAVRQWLWVQQSQFHYNYSLPPPPMFQHLPPGPQIPTSAQPQILLNGDFYIPANNDRHVPHPTAPAPQAPPAPAPEYSVPPIWKRGVAELIDFLLLLVLKVTISMVIFNNLGLLQEEAMDFEFLYKVLRSKQAVIDYDKLFYMTSEMLTLQMIHRFIITMTETLWIFRSFRGGIGGSTPGKLVMGLRVLGCDDVIGIQENQVRIINPRNLGLSSAFMRSVMKNFGISFFFPIVLTMFMFEHSRALYDMGAGSIVVCDTWPDPQPQEPPPPQ